LQGCFLDKWRGLAEDWGVGQEGAFRSHRLRGGLNTKKSLKTILILDLRFLTGEPGFHRGVAERLRIVCPQGRDVLAPRRRPPPQGSWRAKAPKRVPLDPRCPAWSRVVPRSIFFGTRRDTQLRSVDFGLRSGRQQEEARIARILGKRGAFEFGVRNAESGGCDMIMHDNGG